MNTQLWISRETRLQWLTWADMQSVKSKSVVIKAFLPDSEKQRC